MVHLYRIGIICGLIAIALGPYNAMLWATKGERMGGSHPWTRGILHGVFWACIVIALSSAVLS